MARPIPFSDAHKELCEKFKAVEKSHNKFSEMMCRACGRRISDIGGSRIIDICKICEKSALQPKDL